VAIGIDIVADRAAAREALAHLGERTFRRAISMAVNDTGKQSQTYAVRQVAKASGLKAKTVRSAFRLIRSTPATLSAKVRASGRPFRLIDFAARQTRPGVSANAYGERRVYKSTFIATMASGYRNVFTRRGKKRYPIKPLFGPGVPDTLGKEAVLSGVRTYSGERLQANILRQIDRAERKARGFK
jgi:hypothetical protein